MQAGALQSLNVRLEGEQRFSICRSAQSGKACGHPVVWQRLNTHDIKPIMRLYMAFARYHGYLLWTPIIKTPSSKSSPCCILSQWSHTVISSNALLLEVLIPWIRSDTDNSAKTRWKTGSCLVAMVGNGKSWPKSWGRQFTSVHYLYPAYPLTYRATGSYCVVVGMST